MKRIVPLLPLLALYVLHTDIWLWNDTRLLWGLPIGLTYHVGFCLAAVLAMAILVRYRWPDRLAERPGREAGVSSRPPKV